MFHVLPKTSCLHSSNILNFAEMLNKHIERWCSHARESLEVV